MPHAYKWQREKPTETESKAYAVKEYSKFTANAANWDNHAKDYWKSLLGDTSKLIIGPRITVKQKAEVNHWFDQLDRATTPEQKERARLEVWRNVNYVWLDLREKSERRKWGKISEDLTELRILAASATDAEAAMKVWKQEMRMLAKSSWLRFGEEELPGSYDAKKRKEKRSLLLPGGQWALPGSEHYRHFENCFEMVLGKAVTAEPEAIKLRPLNHEERLKWVDQAILERTIGLKEVWKLEDPILNKNESYSHRYDHIWYVVYDTMYESGLGRKRSMAEMLPPNMPHLV